MGLDKTINLTDSKCKYLREEGVIVGIFDGLAEGTTDGPVTIQSIAQLVSDTVETKNPAEQSIGPRRTTYAYSASPKARRKVSCSVNKMASWTES